MGGLEQTEHRDLWRLLKGGVRQVIATLPPLITFPIFTHTLSQKELGVWQLMTSAAMLLGLADLGLSVAVQRAAVTPDKEHAYRMVGLTNLTQALLLPVLGVGMYFLTVADLPDASASLSNTVGLSMLVMLPGGACLAYASPYRMFAFARGGATSIANARLLASFFYLAALGASAVTKAGIWGYTLAFSVQAAFELFFTLRACRVLDPNVPLAPLFIRDRKTIRQALADGSAQLAIMLGGVLAPRIDLFVLTRLLPPVGALDVVGIYGITGKVADQAYGMPKQVVNPLMPQLGQPGERATAVRLGNILLGGAICSGMTAIVLNGEATLVWWLGDLMATPTAKTVLLLLSISWMIVSVCEVPASMVMLGGKSGWAAATPILAESVVRFAISIALVPTLGYPSGGPRRSSGGAAVVGRAGAWRWTSSREPASLWSWIPETSQPSSARSSATTHQPMARARRRT